VLQEATNKIQNFKTNFSTSPKYTSEPQVATVMFTIPPTNTENYELLRLEITSKLENNYKE